MFGRVRNIRERNSVRYGCYMSCAINFRIYEIKVDKWFKINSIKITSVYRFIQQYQEFGTNILERNARNIKLSKWLCQMFLKSKRKSYVSSLKRLITYQTLSCFWQFEIRELSRVVFAMRFCLVETTCRWKNQ